MPNNQDISKIKLNNTVYNIKDEVARQAIANGGSSSNKFGGASYDSSDMKMKFYPDTTKTAASKLDDVDLSKLSIEELNFLSTSTESSAHNLSVKLIDGGSAALLRLDIDENSNPLFLELVPGSEIMTDKTSFGKVYYDSSSSTIFFYSNDTVFNNGVPALGSAPICTLNAAPFIKDAMVESVNIVPSIGGSPDYLVITWNSDANIEPTAIPLTSIFNASNYYNKTEADAKYVTSIGYDTTNGKVIYTVNGTAIEAFSPQTSPQEGSKQLITSGGVYTTINQMEATIANKVDAVPGKDLSTNDFTNALLDKLNGIAAGAQVNVINGIKVHGASTNLPVTNGVVELPEQAEIDLDDYYDKDEVDTLIDNIPAGPQGPKGDTVVVDTEGLEQFDLANTLDSSSTTDGLTARQGKILKQVVTKVFNDMNTILNALAGVAFTSLPKPTLDPIDWTGGTFYVSISKSLTGVTDTNDAVQVAENAAYTNTLTPQSGLTMKSVVVTMGGVDITSTAYTAATGVISIAQVTGSVVITALAEQVVTYNVTKKLLNMASNAADDTTDADFGYKHNIVVDGANYIDTIAPVNGATYNNDLKVYVDGVLLTAGTDYTYTNNVLTIPTANITGEVVIVATAHTGIVSVKANTSGATMNVTHNGTTSTITCDTSDGNGGYDGSLDIGNDGISDYVITSKTAITSIDFGGALYTGTFGGNAHGLGNSSNANTVIEEFKGLVAYKPSTSSEFGRTFQGCTSLRKIDTIGWIFASIARYSYDIFKNCSSLECIDLSGMPLSVSNFNEGTGLFSGCTSLRHIIYPADMSGVTSMKNFYFSIGSDMVSDALVVSGGKFTAVTSLQALAQKANLKVLDLSNIDCDTITIIDSMLFQANIDTLIIGNLGLGNLTSKTNWLFSPFTLNKIVCKSTTPPAVNTSSNWLSDLPSTTKIYVPDSAETDYKEAAGWSVVAGQIYKISEMK